MRRRRATFVAFIASALVGACACAQPIPIFNADFEFDAAVTSPPTGWTASAGTMYVTSGSGLSPVDPTIAFSGGKFLTANRLAPNPDASFPNAQTMSVFQNVDVTSLAAEIDMGDRYIQLDFAYNDADADDNGTVSINFLDDAALPLGSSITFQTSSQPTASGGWSTAWLAGAVPVGARSIQFSLAGERTSGTSTVRNVNFDDLSAQLVDGPPEAPPRDVVHGNLIQFTDNGAWSWFQDERAIVDPQHGVLLVGSVANRDGIGGETADGWVKTTIFDLNTGGRSTTQHKDLESYGGGDDHNAPAYLKLPNGNYLATYAAHNHISNNGPYPNDGGTRLENYKSYYRIYDVATDTWGPESEYDWSSVIPAGAPGEGGTTYSNLFRLSAENGGQGRIYNIARTQQSPHIMYSDDNGATWTYGGQLTKQADDPPMDSYVNGYFKYWSNGVDRIDFIATEFHPRDYNTSVYHGYIQNGKMYNSYANEIDNDIYSEATSFDADGLPTPDAFTQIFQAATTSNSRAWVTDIHRYDDGSIAALFKARAGGFGSHSTGANDHRVWYARFEPGSGQWTVTEIAKAGGQLFGGSETDYTGLGAIHPDNPNTIYISTEIDPITQETLPHHEIYKGVTTNGGMNWTWTAVTENSSYDNLRPIIPKWDGDNTAVLWWRGSMDTSHDYDTAVVGVIERNAELVGKVTYVDASLANTTLADGLPLTTTGPANGDGPADGFWHLRAGTASNNTVFTADESGTENVPTLKTTVSGLQNGKYDVFAFFWSDIGQDWRLEAGLAEDAMLLYRLRASQQAEADQFDASPVLDLGSVSLYRAYLGRVDVAEGGSIEVFVNDSTGSGTQRVWYDGVGYASVTPAGLAGDYNNDGRVDAGDYVRWRNSVGDADESALHFNGDGGDVSFSDYLYWKERYGDPDAGSGEIELHAVPEPNGLVLLLMGGFGLYSQRPSTKRPDGRF